MKQLFILLFCFSLIPVRFFAVTTTWTGTEDTDWHKSCNWDTDAVPTCSDAVVIPNVTNDPVISGIAHCASINIQSSSGALLTIQSSTGGELEIGTCPTAKTDNSASCPAACPADETVKGSSGVSCHTSYYCDNTPPSTRGCGGYTEYWDSSGPCTSGGCNYRRDYWAQAYSCPASPSNGTIAFDISNCNCCCSSLGSYSTNAVGCNGSGDYELRSNITATGWFRIRFYNGTCSGYTTYMVYHTSGTTFSRWTNNSEECAGSSAPYTCDGGVWFDYDSVTGKSITSSC